MYHTYKEQSELHWCTMSPILISLPVTIEIPAHAVWLTYLVKLGSVQLAMHRTFNILAEIPPVLISGTFLAMVNEVNVVMWWLATLCTMILEDELNLRSAAVAEIMMLCSTIRAIWSVRLIHHGYSGVATNQRWLMCGGAVSGAAAALYTETLM